jgi:hypothetical protein
MTAAELIAAGWEEYADGFSRGDWLITNIASPFFSARTYHAALVHNPPGERARSVCAGIASTIEGALEHLAKAKAPDGRTVREWALSPP